MPHTITTTTLYHYSLEETTRFAGASIQDELWNDYWPAIHT